MKRIPKAFSLMGQRITVHVIHPRDWPHGEDCLGIFEPSHNRIDIVKQPRAQLFVVFWHEVYHAMYFALSHKLYSNEQHIDQMAGLQFQIQETAEY